MAQFRADAALLTDKLKREIEQLKKALAEALNDNNHLRQQQQQHSSRPRTAPQRQHHHYNDDDNGKPPFVVRAIISEDCPHCCPKPVSLSANTIHVLTAHLRYDRSQRRTQKEEGGALLPRCTCPR
jgi:hypothetical protein